VRRSRLGARGPFLGLVADELDAAMGSVHNCCDPLQIDAPGLDLEHKERLSISAFRGFWEWSGCATYTAGDRGAFERPSGTERMP
jgi:hypothetical protein